MIELSCPGRVCLFGEDLDYMKLHVITAAINLRMHIRGDLTNNDQISVYYQDLNTYDEFRISQPAPYRKKRDYIRAAFNVLNRSGYEISQGIKATIWSEIPIGRGLASSSVLTVIWIAFLNELCHFGLSKSDIAELAYQSEVVENNESGGNMDHYACALGNGMHMDCSCNEITPINLDHITQSIVIADTLIVKKELVHAERRQNIMEGIKWFSKYTNFDICTTIYEELKPFFSKIPPKPLKHALAILRLRDITEAAERELYNGTMNGIVNHQRIGELIDAFHRELVYGFENTTEKTEQIIQSAKNAGALGGKIIGSGFGGCVLLYCPGKQEQVAKAVTASGGKPYIVQIDDGIRLEAKL
ncbi:MAG: GHMP family kinase ATP-binding protein [Candidatus Helarchaeota archaeon]